jgi:hypothetical protein
MMMFFYGSNIVPQCYILIATMMMMIVRVSTRYYDAAFIPYHTLDVR